MMQQAVFVAPGKLEHREAPTPRIEGPDEAIIRPVVVGRCDLDSLYLAGRMPLASGAPIGHEIIGEIVDLGDRAAERFHSGQRVIVPAQISCGVCGMCRKGFTGRCESVPFGASYGMGRGGDFGGGLSDLLRVPYAGAMLVPVPMDADPVPMIGLADMATDAWRAVGPALAVHPEASVLVIGGFSSVIAVYSAAMALALGAGSVAYLDANPERRAAAARYGVTTAAHADEISGPFEIVVDAAGDAELLLFALRVAAPEAHVISVAPPFVGPQLPLLELYMKGLTYRTGRPNCRAAHGPTMQAWACRGFRPDLIGPKVFSFSEACEAWLDPALYVAVTR